MKNLSVTSIIFVAAAVLGTGVMSQSDSLTATLLEEILSMKDEINALELRVHDLENSGSCGSSSASGGSSSNDTMTIKYGVFDGSTCSGLCTITTNDGISSVTRTSTGEYTVTWEEEFSNDEYIVVCNANPASHNAAYCGLNNADDDAISSGYTRLEIRQTDASEIDCDLISVFAFKRE